MGSVLVVCSIVLVVFVGIFSMWRIASKRQSLPCPTWLSWMVELDNPFTKTNRAEEILKHLSLQPSMIVVDIGCGPGRLTLPAARLVGPHGKIVAFDVQEGMLARVKERCLAEAITNIDFLQGCVGEGRLKRDFFDCVLLVTVLGEILDKDAAINEIYQVLKPGGICAITEVIFDPHFQNRKTVTKLISNAGFKELGFHGNSLAYTMIVQKIPN